MKLYKNIDVVQIDIKAGVSEYYLPKHVSWADEVVDNIFLYGTFPVEGILDYEEYSPVDGVTPIINLNKLKDVFFDLYSSEDEEIAHNLCGENLKYTNNNPIEINSKLSLQLSRIFFPNAPVKDACLILCVSWGSVEDTMDEIPQKNVTVEFELENGSEISLANIIDTYIHAQGAKVKGIVSWGNYEKNGSKYLTLRNNNGVTIINGLPLNMCRPPLLIRTEYFYKAECYQISPLYLDSEDIDFANSFIQNASQSEGSSVVKLTFLY